MRLRALSFSLVLLSCLGSTISCQGTHKRTSDSLEVLGTVNFPTSCSESSHKDFELGIARLHHMNYAGAAESFARVIQEDPECAMGYWGRSMTVIHPLWTGPTDNEYETGRALLEEAKTLEPQTDREQAYIAALEAYYVDGFDQDPHRSRLANAEPAWRELHRKYPEDLEAAAFYSLFLMATAPQNDKTYGKQIAAGAIGEKVLAQIPDHPGAHHYIIHAYDVPPLAEGALNVARNYGHIAPNDPHALHMPSHIFTRLGMWEESIAWNLRSAEAARQKGRTSPLGHALDYLVYAYLQTAQDGRAKIALDEINSLAGSLPIEEGAGYAVAATIARVALERQKWADAAKIPARSDDAFWDTFPHFEAIRHFTRAIGAARSGDTKGAKQSIEKLEEIHAKVSAVDTYWGKQIEVQLVTSKAWLAYGEGKEHRGLEMMRRAAELEALTEKDAVTPGEVLPSAELYGDMLSDAGRYVEAQAAFEVALKRSPGRFNSIYGIAFAAERAGDNIKARSFYSTLIEMSVHADTRNDKLEHAKEFLMN